MPALQAAPAPGRTKLQPADRLSAFTGSAGQKGRVMGILRSLGALARALGPILSATGEWGCSAFLLLPRSLGEPTAWGGGRRGGDQEGKPQLRALKQSSQKEMALRAARKKPGQGKCPVSINRSLVDELKGLYEQRCQRWCLVL